MNQALFAIWLLAISPFVGSFIGVLADRLARGGNVITGRSRCANCARALPYRDMVPLLSVLWLGGKCRHCAAPIPRQLFWAEALAVLIACAAVFSAADVVQMGLAAAWMWVLLALGLADATSWRLPDVLNGALVVAGAGLGLSAPGAGVADVFASALIGVGGFWLIRLGYGGLRRREGLGMGDVKIMAGIGAALPVTALPVVTLVAALAALAMVRIWPEIQKSRDGAAAVPFGAFLAGAAGIVWIALNLPLSGP